MEKNMGSGNWVTVGFCRGLCNVGTRMASRCVSPLIGP